MLYYSWQVNAYNIHCHYVLLVKSDIVQNAIVNNSFILVQDPLSIQHTLMIIQVDNIPNVYNICSYKSELKKNIHLSASAKLYLKEIDDWV